jgi:ABC-type transport system substrate-binding protein
MRSIKVVLLAAPTLVSLVLLQSYVWVPTFEDQARADPGRLTRYISASIGDASILNPALSADSASSEVESQVFEGLIDRDLDLSFRGRVAQSWRIFEEAYLFADESLRLADGTPATATTLQDRLRRARRTGDAALAGVEGIDVVPAETTTADLELGPPEGKPGAAKRTVKVTIRRPARLKLTLRTVDQDLFAKLDRLLGGYVTRLEARRYVEAPDPAAVQQAIADELVVPTEANPVILFTLRKGIRFHDGQEVTAADVKFTYETIVDPKNLSPRASDFEPIKEVVTPDRYTVRVTYKRLFQPGFERWEMSILPAHLLSRERLTEEARLSGRDPKTYTVRDAAFNRRPTGSGPFRFDAWRTDQFIRLRRFDGYWEGPANFHEYLIRVIPDALTTEVAFYAGTADAYTAQPHQIARLRDDPRFHATQRLALGYSYIGYNLRRPIFQDVRVRTALGMAINVDEIIKYVLYGQGEHATGPYARQLDYNDPDVRPLPYDPEGAARLLAEAGWKKNAEGILEKDGRPLAFTIITNAGNEERSAVMVIAQNAWRRLGVKVDALSLEWAVFINQRVDKGDFDAVVLGWAMDLSADLYQIFHSSQTGDFQLNFVGYKNPKADALIVRIRQEYDHERQVALARELHRLIFHDQPYTFLYVRRVLSLMDAKIVRMTRRPDGTPEYLPFTPNKLGSIGFHLNEWIKTPRPVLPPYRPTLSPS